MKHSIHRVNSFEVAGPYTLRVAFDDNSEQVINFESVLAGELFLLPPREAADGLRISFGF